MNLALTIMRPDRGLSIIQSMRLFKPLVGLAIASHFGQILGVCEMHWDVIRLRPQRFFVPFFGLAISTDFGVSLTWKERRRRYVMSV